MSKPCNSEIFDRRYSIEVQHSPDGKVEWVYVRGLLAEKLLQAEQQLAAITAERDALKARIEEGEKRDPIGYGMSESEMGIGWDRKMGNVVWFGRPIGNLYTTQIPSPDT